MNYRFHGTASAGSKNRFSHCGNFCTCHLRTTSSKFTGSIPYLRNMGLTFGQHGPNLGPNLPLGRMASTWGTCQVQYKIFKHAFSSGIPTFFGPCFAQLVRQLPPHSVRPKLGPSRLVFGPTCYHTPKLLKAAPHPQAVAFHIIGVLRQVAPANRIWKTITRMRRDILKGVKNALKLLTPTTRSSTRMTKEFHGCDRAAPSQLP